MVISGLKGGWLFDKGKVWEQPPFLVSTDNSPYHRFEFDSRSLRWGEEKNSGVCGGPRK